jgi:hypothetical protein
VASYARVFDGETVRLFAQYLYQADYSHPVPAPVHYAEPINEPAGHATTPVRPLTPLRSFEIPKLHTVPKCSSHAWPEKPAAYDHEAVLLTHATLYTLSRAQGINTLSDLCISRLRRVPKVVSPGPIDPLILENVVELLRYAYCSPREVAMPEPRNLVSQF